MNFGNAVEQKEYVVGIEDLNYLPFYRTDEQKNVSGASVEIMQLFAQNKGILLKFRPLPVKRLYKEMLDGGIDFKFPDNKKWNIEQKKDRKIFYTQGVLKYTDGVLSKNIKMASAINRLGTIRGFTPWDYLDLIHAKQVALEEIENIQRLFDMLIKERIDGIYMNIDVGKYYAKEQGILGVEFNKNGKSTTDFYSISTIKHENFIKEFDQFLQSNTEEIKKIKKKYGLR